MKFKWQLEDKVSGDGEIQSDYGLYIDGEETAFLMHVYYEEGKVEALVYHNDTLVHQFDRMPGTATQMKQVALNDDSIDRMRLFLIDCFPHTTDMVSESIRVAASRLDDLQLIRGETDRTVRLCDLREKCGCSCHPKVGAVACMECLWGPEEDDEDDETRTEP